MNQPLLSLVRHRLARVIFLSLSLLTIAGCGGGGDSSSGGSSGGSTTVLGPKTLVGAVIVMTYGDGRSYTYTITSANANGVTRSDGKTSTNWTQAGLSSPVVTLDIAYGAFTPGSLNNVFDDFGLNFSTQTTGNFTLREDVTSNTFATKTPLSGTFTFTTYPPNG